MTDVDVAVVGGGLLGSAVTWRLASSGARTALLEKDQVNRHASGQNAGSLHFQLEYRMIENGMEEARRAAEALPLHLDAAKEWASLGQVVGEDLGVVQAGGLMLAESAAQARRLEEKVDLERSWGLDVELLDAGEARDRFPYLAAHMAAVAYCPSEGKANARHVAPAFARAATRAGAQIITRAEVTALARYGGRWRVTYLDSRSGAKRELNADAVVLAAGIWTGRLGDLLDVSLPVIPVALTMMATVRSPKVLPHLVQHSAARLSLKQTAEGNFLIGGGWPARFATTPRGDIELDTQPILVPESIGGNAQAAARVVPTVNAAPILRMWTGATTLTPDQLPLLGAVPGRPGVFVATGGSGFTLGPTYARLLTELIAGETPDLDMTPCDPSRFRSALNG